MWLRIALLSLSILSIQCKQRQSPKVYRSKPTDTSQNKTSSTQPEVIKDSAPEAQPDTHVQVSVEKTKIDISVPKTNKDDLKDLDSGSNIVQAAKNALNTITSDIKNIEPPKLVVENGSKEIIKVQDTKTSESKPEDKKQSVEDLEKKINDIKFPTSISGLLENSELFLGYDSSNLQVNFQAVFMKKNLNHLLPVILKSKCGDLQKFCFVVAEVDHELNLIDLIKDKNRKLIFGSLDFSKSEDENKDEIMSWKFFYTNDHDEIIDLGGSNALLSKSPTPEEPKSLDLNTSEESLASLKNPVVNPDVSNKPDTSVPVSGDKLNPTKDESKPTSNTDSFQSLLED